ncbi:DUF7017 domain-containing protein [Haloferula sp.]|uniref:DUF7017 domain-containing protein n=1 Tax=Haloferula sp. TaxID=2497595 RepID=UPI00329E30BF
MADYQYPSQEVIALRREGKHEEALKLARETFAKEPGNTWGVGALGWCLYDEVKRLKESGDTDALAKVGKELSELKIPESDTMLRKCVDRILGIGPIGKATQLSKEGNHLEAVKLLRRIAKAKGASQYEIEGYGWILYRKLKGCGDEEHAAAIWCLDEFSNCWSGELDPNAMLFKNMLIQAKRQVEKWGGLVPLVERLSLQDINPAEFEDEEPNPDFPSFQDQLLGAVHKCLKLHPAMRESRAELLKWLEAWKEHFSDDEWPQYHLGHLHAWIGGDLNLARDLLLKTVQRKPSQWWRWRAMAEILTGEPRKAVLSRAVTCSDQEPSFKVPLYVEYSEMLAAEGELSAAKASLDEAIRLRILSGEEWKTEMPDWYAGAGELAETDIHEFAQGLAGPADQMLVSDVPLRLGVLVAPTKREGCILYHVKDLGVRNLRFARGTAPPATCKAIEARFYDEPEGISEVLAWDEASIPDDWGDQVPGVVDHLNRNRNLASISLPEGGFLPLHFDRWHSAVDLQPGEFLNIRLLPNSDGKTVVLSWQPAARREVSNFLMKVEGTFSAPPNKPFGFVEGSQSRVFVPPPVAEKFSIGQALSGWALRSKKKDGTLSWNLLPETDRESP